LNFNAETGRRQSGSTLPYSLSRSETRIVKGTEEIRDCTVSLLVRASKDANSVLSIVTDRFGMLILTEYLSTIEESAGGNPELSIRIITDVQSENIQYVKQIIKKEDEEKGRGGIEVRHYERNIRKFFLSEIEILEITHTFENSQPDEGVYSNNPDYLAQLSQMFEILWQRSIPAEQRIAEIEKGGRAPSKTEILQGAEETGRISLKVFSDAEQYFCAVSDWRAPSLAVDVDIYRNAYLDMKKRGVAVKAITEIRKENLSKCEELLEMGLVSELRHIDGCMGNYIVTEKEYLAAPTIQESTQAQEVIYSDSKQMVDQNKYVFDTLWGKAIPAEIKIRQIKEGSEPEETRIIEDLDELVAITEELFEKCKDETLAILASEKTLGRNLKVFERLGRRHAGGAFRNLRVLSPVDDQDILDVMPKAECHRIVPLDVTLYIFDKSKMLLVQYHNPDADSRELAISNSIYTNNKQTVFGIAAVFEALWKESELRKLAESIRDKEERARRQAELMQDILTHDVRNYNQISRLSAELLRDEFGRNNIALKGIIENLLDSINGSTNLLEKVRNLSRIIAETNPSLYPVDVFKAIEDSIKMVFETFPDKKVELSGDFKSLSGKKRGKKKITNKRNERMLLVQADNLLSQAFINILSNAIKYTESDRVPIDIRIDDDVELTKTVTGRNNKRCNHLAF
jgi:signal transduction histidine kinase